MPQVHVQRSGHDVDRIQLNIASVCQCNGLSIVVVRMISNTAYPNSYSGCQGFVKGGKGRARERARALDTEGTGHYN